MEEFKTLRSKYTKTEKTADKSSSNLKSVKKSESKQESAVKSIKLVMNRSSNSTPEKKAFTSKGITYII